MDSYMCSSCASPAQDLGDQVSVTGHSGEWLWLLHFSGQIPVAYSGGSARGKDTTASGYQQDATTNGWTQPAPQKIVVLAPLYSQSYGTCDQVHEHN